MTLFLQIVSSQHNLPALEQPSPTAALPDSLGNLNKLQNIELYGNALRGTLPQSLGRCTSLKRIDVFSNELTGT